MTALYESIRYEVAENILTLTFDRPDKLNTLTREMGEEIISALDRADADPDVRAVILTDSGKAFCGGFALGDRQAFDVGEGTVGLAGLARRSAGSRTAELRCSFG